MYDQFSAAISEYTAMCNAGADGSEHERTIVRFTVAEFDRLVAQIAKDARRRKSLTAADYCPYHLEVRRTDTRAATGRFGGSGSQV